LSAATAQSANHPQLSGYVPVRLTFLRDHTDVEPAALRMADVDAPVVLRFLDYLE